MSYYSVCKGNTLTLSLLDVFSLTSINSANISSISPPSGIVTATIDSNTNISITGTAIGVATISITIDGKSYGLTVNVIDCSQIITTPSGPQCLGVTTTIDMSYFINTTTTGINFTTSIIDVSIADPSIATIVSVDKTNLIVVVKGSSIGSTTIDITFNSVSSFTGSLIGYFSIPFTVKDCTTASLVEFFLSLNQPFSRRC